MIWKMGKGYVTPNGMLSHSPIIINKVILLLPYLDEEGSDFGSQQDFEEITAALDANGQSAQPVTKWSLEDAIYPLRIYTDEQHRNKKLTHVSPEG